MSAQEVRVGFIGCGRHATEVLLPTVRQAGMDLAAICDLDKRRAQRATRRFGAFRAYQDLQRMIGEMELDAVLVCGPPEMHAEAAAVALQHGCHVWTEAPPAPTAVEARRVADLAAGRGLVAQVGLMLRFAPAYERLARIIAGADFGAPVAFEATYWPPALPGHDEPFAFDALHILDLIRHLLGDVEDCRALREDDGRAALALRMQGGATGVASLVQGGPGVRESVTIAGEDAVATVSDRMVVTTRRRDCDEISVWRADALGPGEESCTAHLRGYLPELRHFAASVSAEAEAAATMSEAAAAMRLVEEIAAQREVQQPA